MCAWFIQTLHIIPTFFVFFLLFTRNIFFFFIFNSINKIIISIFFCNLNKNYKVSKVSNPSHPTRLFTLPLQITVTHYPIRRGPITSSSLGPFLAALAPETVIFNLLSGFGLTISIFQTLQKFLSAFQIVAETKKKAFQIAFETSFFLKKKKREIKKNKFSIKKNLKKSINLFGKTVKHVEQKGRDEDSNSIFNALPNFPLKCL